MALTGLAQLPPSFHGLLAPDEKPLAWETVALWGENRIGRSGPPKTIRTVDLNPISAVATGPVDVDPGLFERWLGGIALTGHIGSVADGLGRVLHRAGQPRLAVTTKRLMLVQEGSLELSTSPETGRPVADQPTTELWSATRDHVRSATRRSRPFMAGRLVVEFVDGSTIALMCGIFSPRAAHRLRDALDPRKA